MNQRATFSASSPARRAARLLYAWRGADPQGLNAALESAAAAPSSGDAAECERADLLSGITAELRAMLAAGKTTSRWLVFR